MGNRDRLCRAVEELEAVFRRSAGLATTDFDVNRKQAVALRRLISDELASIFQLGSAYFEGEELSRKFRAEFSRMRSSMAVHHSSWPVVAIKLNDPGYIASVKSLRESNGAFIVWIKGHLSEQTMD